MPLRPTDGCICASCLCGCCCLACWRLSAFHSALRAWVDALNAEVLSPLGLHGRLQSNVKTGCFGFEDTMSWLSVATTPSEGARLREEPVVWTPAWVDAPGGGQREGQAFIMPAGPCAQRIMCCPCAGMRAV